MRISWAMASPVIVVVGCGSGASSPETDGSSNDGGHGQDGISSQADAATPDGGARDSGQGQDGASPPSDAAAAAFDVAPTASDAAATASDAGTTGQAGNPSGSCTAGVPVRGQPADTSHPTAVVGTGTPTSCTFSELQSAVAQGGVITFNCGNGAVTIPISATLNVPTNKNTVIDGGNKVTLDGGKAAQILSFNSANFRANDNGLTLQHIALVNGKKTPTQAIPSAPAPCSQGWNDGEGGAVYVRDGSLTVIDSIFMNNQAAPLGPDTGGGAIYVLGSKNGALIVGSTFSNNTASNAGAVGGLFTELDIYNSLFVANVASGHDANSDAPSKCSAINNGQNEIGSGGNGGAVYSDGNSVNITLCGDAILDNRAGGNAFGGGLFFTSDDMMGTLSITDSTLTGNTGGSWTNVSTGSVTSLGTAVGVNAKSITVTSSTLQGYP